MRCTTEPPPGARVFAPASLATNVVVPMTIGYSTVLWDRLDTGSRFSDFRCANAGSASSRFSLPAVAGALRVSSVWASRATEEHLLRGPYLQRSSDAQYFFCDRLVIWTQVGAGVF